MLAVGRVEWSCACSEQLDRSPFLTVNLVFALTLTTNGLKFASQKSVDEKERQKTYSNCVLENLRRNTAFSQGWRLSRNGADHHHAPGDHSPLALESIPR